MIIYDDIPLLSHKPLPSAYEICKAQQATAQQIKFVRVARRNICNIMQGKDDRLIVIVGPCSIHNIDAANKYSELLQQQQKKLTQDLLLVMRCYFEKPRTTTGWKGFINDPYLDKSYNIKAGLQLARKFLINLAAKKIPAAGEYLNRINQLPLEELMSWYAIGARTTESQPHREMASGLPTPVGFKNTTEGNLLAAINAIKTAQEKHTFCGINYFGEPSIINTTGNKNCHIILRGSKHGSNFDLTNRKYAIQQAKLTRINPRLIIDCSHDNANGNFRRQKDIANYLASTISKGDNNICGLMLESNIKDGKQIFTPNKTPNPEQSITDPCINWKDTIEILENLAAGVKKRRAILHQLK